MSDFFNTDFFNPPKPKSGENPEAYHAPRSLVPKTPKQVPGEDLFAIQRNALKVLNDIYNLSSALGSHSNPKVDAELQRLSYDAENVYRVIRSYLSQFVNKGMGAGVGV